MIENQIFMLKTYIPHVAPPKWAAWSNNLHLASKPIKSRAIMALIA